MPTNEGLPPRRAIRCPEYVLEPRRSPLVMGILNVTPDSFSDGGLHYRRDAARDRALQMIAEGADIIDIGGESTRPGSEPVPVEEETARVLPVIEALGGRAGVPLSIDTRRAEVAEAAIAAGCQIINDVSACSDPRMPSLARERSVPLIIMHMQGRPKSMQVSPRYDDVVKEVKAFLGSRAASLRESGIERDMIIVDPGIGFGKRFRDNLEILRSLRDFRALGYPLLIGASRKAFLGELLDAPADDRLAGSLAVAAQCRAAEVEIIRVHDVKETVSLFKTLDAIERPDSHEADW